MGSSSRHRFGLWIYWIQLFACGFLSQGAQAEEAIRPRLPKQTLISQDRQFDFAYLTRLLDSEKPTHAEDLLKRLDPDLRGSYVLMYGSRSMQGSSLDRPRVLVFDPFRASLVLSFAGPGHKRSDTVEVMSFDTVQKIFSFNRIEFATGQAQITRPSKCLSCHRERPIWDSYDQWPGAYGSRNDDIFLGRDQVSPEAQAFTAFESGRDRAPLYRSLLPLNASRPNTTLGILLAQENYARAARALHQRSDFHDFRAALLGAVLGCDIETFRSVTSQFQTRSYADQAMESLFLTTRSHYEKENANRTYWKEASVDVSDQELRESLQLQLPQFLAPCDSHCYRSTRTNLEYLDSIWPKKLSAEFDTSFRRRFTDFKDGLGDLVEAAPALVAEFLTPIEQKRIFPSGLDPVAIRIEGTPRRICDEIDALKP
jgi:hypothetical protein